MTNGAALPFYDRKEHESLTFLSFETQRSHKVRYACHDDGTSVLNFESKGMEFRVWLTIDDLRHLDVMTAAALDQALAYRSISEIG